MDPLLQMIRRLTEFRVKFVVIGGMAAIAYGSPLITMDADVCTTFDDENLPRILDALRELDPRIRDRPDKMRLPLDPARLRGLKNLYLITSLGKLDLLGEVPDVATFDQAYATSVEIDLGGFRCRVLDLDTLIAAKRVANRDKDRLALRHLEVIRQRRRDQPRLFPE
jgi:predicted nucleotidyltransferase